MEPLTRAGEGVNYPTMWVGDRLLHGSTDDLPVEEILKLIPLRLAQAVVLHNAARRGRRIEIHLDTLLFEECPDSPPGLYVQIPAGALEEREQFIALGFKHHAPWPTSTDFDLGRTLARGMFLHLRQH